MNNFWEQLKWKLYRFMQGRNGRDELARVALYGFLILYIAGMFLRWNTLLLTQKRPVLSLSNANTTRYLNVKVVDAILEFLVGKARQKLPARCVEERQFIEHKLKGNSIFQVSLFQ